MSTYIVRHAKDKFARAIGIGGAAVVGGLAVINIFGTRMINIEVCGYFWIYLTVIMHLMYEYENTKQRPIIEHEEL